jgi:peptidoglycan/xylan/chitin deacetylase (PgdA/CDA1 family)
MAPANQPGHDRLVEGLNMELLTWAVFESHLKTGHACLLNLGGQRGLTVGYAPDTGRMFAQVPLPDQRDFPSANLAEIDLALVQDGDGAFLRLSTASRTVFRARND